MPDPTKTFEDWPPAPVRTDALEEAQRHLDRRERAKNLGAIVQYSVDGLGGQEGNAWCSFFLCQNVRQVLLRRVAAGDPRAADQLARWLRLASGTCATLLRHLSASEVGWAWSLGSGADLPALADIGFFGERPHHVGWVSRLFDVRIDEGRVAGKVAILSGNAGRQADRVAEQVYDLAQGQPCYFARLPW